MSFLSGQPHHTGAPGQAGQPLTPHEARAAGQTPPPLPDVQFPKASPGRHPARPAGPRKQLPAGVFSLAAFAYLVPDDDPWRRAHWRLSSEAPGGH